MSREEILKKYEGYFNDLDGALMVVASNLSDVQHLVEMDCKAMAVKRLDSVKELVFDLRKMEKQIDHG